MPKIDKQSPAPPARPRPAVNGTAWDLVDHLKVLLYGKSGTGKTRLWATFPGPILALICSGGNKPGELRSINTPEHRKKITPKLVTSFQQYSETVEEASSYATVVLDHASAFADLLVKELLGLAEIPVSKYRRAGKGESWSLVSQQQYGQLAIQCKEAFRALLNVPANVVIVAQERTFGGKKEDGASPEPVDSELIKPTVGAALTPSITGWLNPACDYVLQTYLRPRVVKGVMKVAGEEIETAVRERGVEYCVRTEPHEIYQTKFRLAGDRALPECLVLGNSVDGPDNKETAYQKIMKLIEG